MRYETISLEVEDGIATVTLDRPGKMNTVNKQMRLDVADAFDRTDRDDSVRAVIVTGAGRIFCAGADLSDGKASFDYTKKTTPGEAFRDGGGQISMRIFRSIKPVIGAVNGAAVGFGATVLLPMDVRIAADTARFGFLFTRRGIVPDAASTWFLPRLVGISRALQWFYSGNIFPAEEALRHGLVQSVHSGDDLLPAARAIARDLTQYSAAVSIAVTRQMCWRMLGAADALDAHLLDSKLIFERGQSADSREGVAAFLEKRDPHYPNLPSTDMPPSFPWWDDTAR